MTTSRQTLAPFDLLSEAARQRLRARVSDASGSITVVRDEVAASLAALDQQVSAGATDATYHAQRAFHIAQLAYLDHLAANEQQAEPVRRGGLWARLTRSLGRA